MGSINRCNLERIMAALNCINLPPSSFPCSLLIGRDDGEAPPTRASPPTEGYPTAYHCPLNRHHNGCGLSPMWAVEKGRNLQYFHMLFRIRTATLDSGIDVGQGINVGPGTFGKKNKRRDRKFGKKRYRARKLCQKE